MNKEAKLFKTDPPKEGTRVIALNANDITILTYQSEHFSKVICANGSRPTHWIEFPTLQVLENTAPLVTIKS